MGKSSGFLRRVKLALGKLGKKFGSTILNPGNRIPYTKPNMTPNVPHDYQFYRTNPIQRLIQQQRDAVPPKILDTDNKNQMFNPPVSGNERLLNPTNVTIDAPASLKLLIPSAKIETDDEISPTIIFTEHIIKLVIIPNIPANTPYFDLTIGFSLSW